MDVKQESPMGEPLDAVEWARTVEPARPLTLGEMEAEVMARPLPPKAPIGGGGRVVQGIGFVLLAAVLLGMIASPIVGPAIIAAHVQGVDRITTSGLLPLARIAIVVTAALPFAIVSVWWTGRDRYRTWWNLPVLAYIMIVAAISLVLVLAAGEFEWTFVAWIAVAAVAGLGACIGLLVASRRGPRPERVRMVGDEERHAQVRAEVLGVLRKRNLAAVEPNDVTVRLMDLPRGGWIEHDRQRGVS